MAGLAQASLSCSEHDAVGFVEVFGTFCAYSLLLWIEKSDKEHQACRGH